MSKMHVGKVLIQTVESRARDGVGFVTRKVVSALTVGLKHTFIVWIVCMLAVFFTFTPGYMSPDSLNMWRGAGALDNLYIYHPPFMSYLFFVGRQLTADQSGILFLQLLLFFSGLRLILSETISSRVAQSAILITVSLWPAIFPILGVLWKSVWMTGFLLAGIGFTQRFLRTASLWAVVGAIIAIVLATLARYDAIAPAGVILFVIAFRGYRIILPNVPIGKPYLKMIAGRIGICLAAGFIGVLALGAMVGSINKAITVGTLHPSHVFLYQDLLSVSVESGEVFVPAYVREENQNLTVDQLAKAYNPSTCNAFLKHINRQEGAPYRLRRPTTEEEADQFKQEWLRAITSHPGAYIEGRRKLLVSLWGFKERPHLPYYSRVNKNEMGLRSDPALLKLAAYNYALYVAYELTWFHRPWVYIIAALGVFCCFLFRAKTPAAPAYFLLSTTGLAHFSVMSSIACAGDFRFAYFIVTCVVIGSAIALLATFKPSALVHTSTAWLR